MAPELGEHGRGIGRWQEREGRSLGPGTELLDRELRGLGVDSDVERGERGEGTPDRHEAGEVEALAEREQSDRVLGMHLVEYPLLVVQQERDVSETSLVEDGLTPRRASRCAER